MIKIEFDEKEGRLRTEERCRNEHDRIAQFLTMVNMYYCQCKEKEPEYAERFKNFFLECVKDGDLFCEQKELHERVMKQRKEVMDKLLEMLGGLFNDEEKEKEEKPKTKTSKKITKKTTKKTKKD